MWSFQKLWASGNLKNIKLNSSSDIWSLEGKGGKVMTEWLPSHTDFIAAPRIRFDRFPQGGGGEGTD